MERGKRKKEGESEVRESWGEEEGVHEELYKNDSAANMKESGSARKQASEAALACLLWRHSVSSRSRLLGSSRLSCCFPLQQRVENCGNNDAVWKNICVFL